MAAQQQIAFPPSLIALQQADSVISTSAYDQIHGQHAFPLPVTSTHIAQLGELVAIALLCSTLPRAEKEELQAFVASVVVAYGMADPAALQPVPPGGAAPFALIVQQLAAIRQDQAAMRQDQAAMRQDLAGINLNLQQSQIMRRNRAMAACKLPLQAIPVDPNAENQLPAAFVNCPLRRSADVRNLAIATINATALAYGLNFRARTTKDQKAEAIWGYIGGQRIVLDS